MSIKWIIESQGSEKHRDYWEGWVKFVPVEKPEKSDEEEED